MQTNMQRNMSPAKAIAEENRLMASQKSQSLVQRNRSKIESSLNQSSTNPAWL